MSAEQLNAFLHHVAQDPGLQHRLRTSDAITASALAGSEGFAVTVGDLIRYKARATTWRLSDAELEVVARWQPPEQPYWWQYIWADADVDSNTSTSNEHQREDCHDRRHQDP